MRLQHFFLILPLVLRGADPAPQLLRPAGWEVVTQGAERFETTFLRTEGEDLWLDADGGRRVPLTKLKRVEHRSERTLLPLPKDQNSFRMDGSEASRIAIPLPMEKSLRLRFRISQEGGTGWSLMARRLTRAEHGTSERPELTLRQSKVGLDVRDLGSRFTRRAQTGAPPAGAERDYEVLMNWDPPSFAVFKEGVPLFVSELPGIEGEDRERELIFMFPEGVQTMLSQVEVSLADGKLPDVKRPKAKSAPPAPATGRIRIFFSNQDHIEADEVIWEEGQIRIRLAGEGFWIPMPSERVRMVRYSE